MTQVEPTNAWTFTLAQVTVQDQGDGWVRIPVPLAFECAVTVVVRFSAHFPEAAVPNHWSELICLLQDRVGDSTWDTVDHLVLQGWRYGATDRTGTLRVSAPLGDAARFTFRLEHKFQPRQTDGSWSDVRDCDDSGHDHSSLVVTDLRADVFVRNL